MLNEHVQALNNGLMPVITHSPDELFAEFNTLIDEQQKGTKIHSLASSTTRWAWAVDRIPLEGASGTVLFSIGDVLYFLGKFQTPFFFGITILLILIEVGWKSITALRGRWLQ